MSITHTAPTPHNHQTISLVRPSIDPPLHAQESRPSLPRFWMPPQITALRCGSTALGNGGPSFDGDTFQS